MEDNKETVFFKDYTTKEQRMGKFLKKLEVKEDFGYMTMVLILLGFGILLFAGLWIGYSHYPISN